MSHYKGRDNRKRHQRRAATTARTQRMRLIGLIAEELNGLETLLKTASSSKSQALKLKRLKTEA